MQYNKASLRAAKLTTNQSIPSTAGTWWKTGWTNHDFILPAPLIVLAAIFICNRRLGLWPQLLVTLVCSGCHPLGSISLQPAPISKSKPEGVMP
jgi:hypothetical protein